MTPAHDIVQRALSEPAGDYCLFTPFPKVRVIGRDRYTIEIFPTPAPLDGTQRQEFSQSLNQR